MIAALLIMALCAVTAWSITPLFAYTPRHAKPAVVRQSAQHIMSYRDSLQIRWDHAKGMWV